MMSNHKHTMEYTQTGSSFQKNIIQKRCFSCGFKSYCFSTPVDVFSKLEQDQKKADANCKYLDSLAEPYLWPLNKGNNEPK